MYLAVWKLEGRYFRLFHMSFHFTVSNLMVSSTDKRKKKASYKLQCSRHIWKHKSKMVPRQNAFLQCMNSASERTLEAFLQCMNSASERWWQSVDCCINVLKTEQSQGSVFFYAEIDLQQEYLYENVNSISNSSNSEWTWRTEQMSCRTKAIQ